MPVASKTLTPTLSRVQEREKEGVKTKMPMTRAKVLDEFVTPVEALVGLCSPFVGATGVGPECEVVGKDEIPEPFRWLLVHRNHMTKVLEAQYGRPMELEVVEREPVELELVELVGLPQLVEHSMRSAATRDLFQLMAPLTLAAAVVFRGEVRAAAVKLVTR